MPLSCLAIAASVFATTAAGATARATGKWYMSTEQAQWTERDVTAVDPGSLPGLLTLTDDWFQTMTGFGACFNELGWEALKTLSEADRQLALKKLWGPEELGLTYNRVPIGASDYGDGWYSHNEMPWDFPQANFTLARDEGNLIPYIKAAQAYMDTGSDRQYLFASAWSPPTWMKLNHLSPQAYSECGPGPFGLNKTDEMQSSYALYLSKFVTEYGKRGINVTSVMVQNEPYAGGCNYPKCEWTGAAMRDFIKGYFGPLFAEEHGPDAAFPSESWLGTLNTDNFTESAQTVYEDKEAAKYTAGMAFQWAGASIIARAHEEWPHLPLIQSENECGDGQNTWEYALHHIFNRYHAFIAGGASAYVYWNAVLDGPSHGASHWGWHQNSMVSVWNGSVVLNPEYYLMKHFSHVVRPGAQRVGVTGDPYWSGGTQGLGNALAFLSTAGELIVVLVNADVRARNLTVVASGEAYAMLVPPKSLNTFVLPAASPCADGFSPLPGDCPGNNGKHVTGGTVQSCKDLCRSDAACAGFSFNCRDAGFETSSCYLKTRKCDVVTPSGQSNGYYFWDKCGVISVE